jgi:hypothetical protein
LVNTDNGFFDCHAEHADQNRLLDTDINLSTVSYLSSDDELLSVMKIHPSCVIPCHL